MERYTRFAPSGTVETDAASRVVRYVFSDESVGRDGHIVKADAWQTENFEANPVFLWAHSDDTPPIGRVFGLNTQQRELRGAVKYAETDFADSIYQLVRGGFLSATSTSWQPIKYDRMPNGSGLIFTEVDLLEISQCPVPALPTALATARSTVNVSPLHEWASKALDTGRLGTLDRPLVEAICRAAGPSRTTSIADTGREERMRRARALQRDAEMTDEDERKYQRYEALREYGFSLERIAQDLLIPPESLRAIVAKRLARGSHMSSVVPFEARKFSTADKEKLRGTAKHLERAEKQHRTLSGHHDTVGDHARAAQAVYRSLTATLKAFGESRAARTTSTLAELGYDHGKVSRALIDLGAALDGLSEAHGDAEDCAESARTAMRQAQSGVNGMLGTGSDE